MTKNKTCAIMQPTYIPWLGYFNLIDNVEKFVFLNDVQLQKRSWQVRNKIKTPNGELFLTISIKKTKSRNELMIKDAVIDDKQLWRRDHLKSIKHSYNKSEYFEQIYPFLENLISADIIKLGDFNINIITQVCRKIGIKSKLLCSSDLEGVTGKKDEKLVSICKKIDCDKYISVPGSAEYIEKNNPGGAFPANQIKLFYQNYEHPVYKQLYSDFLPYMSIIDLLFNHGFEKSLNIIKKGRKDPIDYFSFRKEK